MLKIKENVDLKELEKFGFRRAFNGYMYYYYYVDELNAIKIIERNIIILLCNIVPTTIEDIDVIFDLIQAGLVEKVDV